MAKELKIKIDWLCLCLDGPAYKLNKNTRFFIVRWKWAHTTRSHSDARKDYRYQSMDPDLGDTMQVWHVQTKNWPEIDPGLVSTLYGFTDSPDAEV